MICRGNPPNTTKAFGSTHLYWPFGSIHIAADDSPNANDKSFWRLRGLGKSRVATNIDVYATTKPKIPNTLLNLVRVFDGPDRLA